MDICTNFPSTVECVLTLNNEMTIKLIVFGLLFIYSLFGIYITRKQSLSSESYFESYKTFFFKYSSYLFVGLSPLLFLLMLNINLRLETFITFIVTFYFLFLGLSIGAGLLFSKEIITNTIFNSTKRKEMMYKFKYRKYGKD